MRVRIVAVGKMKPQRELQDAVDDYVGRIGRYVRVDVAELREGQGAELAERFERAIPDRSRVVALEVAGAAWSSERLARFVQDSEGSGVSHMVFLIGGADGLPPETSRAADHRVSLSAMTLPHRLARLVLSEQIYRAYTIARGEPYNH